MPRSRKPAPGAGDLAGYRNLIRSGGLTAIQSRERPIIFSAESVRALLAGRKTQTRRICKAQPASSDVGPVALRNPQTLVWHVPTIDGYHHFGHCPFGAVGDRLWVREAWALAWDSALIEGTREFVYRADKATNRCPAADAAFAKSTWRNIGRWRSPIHMPRAASRLTLEIAAVRVERLQDISAADVEAEGFGKLSFPGMWESINGPGSWADNPFVWVIEFKRVEPVAGGGGA